jgi:hypothetical protein
MAGHDGDSRVYEPEAKRSSCGVLHQELERVKKDADGDSIFLNKLFLSECIENLDRCTDSPILEEVKKRVERKKRVRLDRANRAKNKHHKKTDSV